MSIRGILKHSVLVGLVLAVCGCGRPNIIGSDAAVYSTGTLYAVSSQDLNSVYSATLAAMKQLEIEVAEQNKDVFYAMVVGKVADGRTVTIRIQPGEGKVTELRIKASTMGNEERSRVIYEKIQQNLKSGSK
jgi:hypothetical protein